VLDQRSTATDPRSRAVPMDAPRSPRGLLVFRLLPANTAAPGSRVLRALRPRCSAVPSTPRGRRFTGFDACAVITGQRDHLAAPPCPPGFPFRAGVRLVCRLRTPPKPQAPKPPLGASGRCRARRGERQPACDTHDLRHAARRVPRRRMGSDPSPAPSRDADYHGRRPGHQVRPSLSKPGGLRSSGPRIRPSLSPATGLRLDPRAAHLASGGPSSSAGGL